MSATNHLGAGSVRRRYCTSLGAGHGRSPAVRLGRHLRGLFDRIIARSSLVSTDPVLDVRDFPWTQDLRDRWQAIRDEAVAVARDADTRPLAGILPDHRAIAPVDRWHGFPLWSHGHRIAENIERCPVAAAAMARIPGLDSALFSIIAPDTHIPPHRGVTKGLITCHLGLVVPADGDARMRVGNRVLRWAEGETLVFDDTYDHEVWNDTRNTRVVLLIQVRRPLRNPGKWLADALLGVLRRSASGSPAPGGSRA